jgi:hypothetical protein
MPFPDYVTLHWPRPGQPSPKAWGSLPIRLATVRGLSGEQSGSTAGDPRLRPTGVGLRHSGAKSLDPSDVTTVPGVTPVVQIRSLLSTQEGGHSLVA